jgi:tetratricopeptide (TPR) repeat protein
MDLAYVASHGRLCYLRSMAVNNIGAALGNRGEDEKAIEHFTRALAIRPDYPDAQGNYRKALLRREVMSSGHPGAVAPGAAAGR